MSKVFFACLMCLINWCHSSNYRLRNSLEASYLPNIIHNINLSNQLDEYKRNNHNNGVVETGDVTLPFENKSNREGRYLCTYSVYLKKIEREKN